jgi:hypothetical protein
MKSVKPAFNLCNFCAINSQALCPFEGMSDGIDEPLRGHMAQCNEFRRPENPPPLGLWAARLTALHYLVNDSPALFFFPLPNYLFWHLARLDFAAALEWHDAR